VEVVAVVKVVHGSAALTTRVAANDSKKMVADGERLVTSCATEATMRTSRGWNARQEVDFNGVLNVGAEAPTS
ncbi:MAG: hypothetical protein ACRD33_09680, partial [Candidatus Acidiferrales bacterium]